MRSTPPGGGQPSRLDRELMELLQELRVVLPGVQVLFAFLLTVPFTTRFERIDDFHRIIFFTAFLSTAGSAALLMAPSVQHRLRFRRFDKEALLRSSNRLTLMGTALLSLAIASVMLLVADLVVDRVTAIVATVGVSLLIAGTWYVAPLLREEADDDMAPPDEARVDQAQDAQKAPKGRMMTSRHRPTLLEREPPLPEPPLPDPRPGPDPGRPFPAPEPPRPDPDPEPAPEPGPPRPLQAR